LGNSSWRKKCVFWRKKKRFGVKKFFGVKNVFWRKKCLFGVKNSVLLAKKIWRKKCVFLAYKNFGVKTGGAKPFLGPFCGDLKIQSSIKINSK